MRLDLFPTWAKKLLHWLTTCDVVMSWSSVQVSLLWRAFHSSWWMYPGRCRRLVLRWRPSGVASAHRNGPRGWDSTSAICRFRPCPITIMRPNNALSALRITDLPLILTCFFLHKLLKVFSLFIFIGSWDRLIGRSITSLSALKFV